MTPVAKLKPVEDKLITEINLKELIPYLIGITKCSPTPSFVAAEWAVFEEGEWNEINDLLTINLETKKNTNAKVAIYLSNRDNYTISLDNGTILSIVEDNFTDTLLIEFQPNNTQAVLEILFGEEIEDDTPPDLKIKRPLKYLYIFDREIMPTIFGDPIILGKITIKANAMDNQSGMDKVEFYIDDVLKSNDTESPYQWTWNGFAEGKHTIKAIAYDTKGKSASDDILVWRVF